MMIRLPLLHSSASRIVLALVCTGSAVPALAGSFTVPPATGQQTVSGSDTGKIDADAILSTGSSASIVWNGNATASPGVVITNSGTITSTNRTIDTTGAFTGTFTLDNKAGGKVNSKDDAFRINGPLANGTVVVNNAGVITSQTGQALDFDKATAATATITIGNTGTISSAGSDAIRLGGGTIGITNSGTIATTSSGKRAIKFDTASNFDTLKSLTIVNEASGVITGTDDAIKISSTTSSTAAPVISITNAGTIQSKSGGQGIDLGDIYSTNATITITNQKTGLITAADNDGIQGTNGVTINNYGTISSYYAAGTADTQNNSAVKVSGDDQGHAITLKVNNYAGALITGAYHGIKATGTDDNLIVTNNGTIEGRNGSGVNSNGTGTVVNYGLISGTFDPAASFGDGDGVDFDKAGTVYNYGTIEGLGSKGIKPGETKPSTSEGIAIGGGLIVNGDAAHTSALISGANNGILADDSNGGDAFAALTVTNYGTIQGLAGYGIRYVNSGVDTSKSLTIYNYGTISGTTYAVQMGGGNDLFVIGPKGSVVGIVDAEGGFDTLQLGANGEQVRFDVSLLGNSSTYRNFERLTTGTDTFTTLYGTSDFAGSVVFDQAAVTLQGASLANASVSVTGTALMEGNLFGWGTVGSLSISSEANVDLASATTRFGTLNVVGNAAIAGSYVVDVDTSGHTDLISVGGKTTIADGAQVYMFGELAWGTHYTILSSDGGISGSFGSLNVVTPIDYLFVDPALSQDTNNVYLALERNGVAFSSFAVTPNQRSVAGALERIGAGPKADTSKLYSAFVTQTADDKPTLALSQLSGDLYATLPGQMATENMMVNDLILGRLRQAGYAGAKGAEAALGAGGPARAYADPATPGAQAFKAIKAPEPGPVWTTWAQGYGQWLSTSANGNAAAADTNLGGLLIGADVSASNWVMGLAAGYSSASTSADAASANTETWRIAAYGGATFDAIKLRAGASYGWSSIDQNRFVALTGESPKASYTGTAGNLFAEAGYTFAFSGVALEPFAGIGWTSVDLGSFIENNAPVAGLSSTGTSFDTAYSTLGLRVATSFNASGIVVTPHASAGWRHAFGDVTPQTVLSFINTGTAFGIDGLAIAEDSIVGSAGIDFAFATGATFSLGYEGMAGDGTSYNAGKATLAVKF
ncbi:autotransporter outer membrane beta-barrel domain-containing protein [Xanthobacter sp. 126]|uniref:autotransporter outer membrane beta-barrel domain-containing protein n=1 Tax=Xanthobacter sp. 126 TaxID=1131814 RepID=UPI00045E62D9|nr:autotransporter outer membrane beta-barrel domain-containing protein [Xanthobacter sp. 126]